MLKSQLIHNMIKKIQLAEKDVEAAINRVLEKMSDAMEKGSRIEIRDFGCFYLRYRAMRNAHNPKTGQKVVTTPKYAIRFKAGKEMRERVNESRTNFPIANEEL